MASQPSGHWKGRRGKSREPSHITREELGNMEVRLAKVELKLIDGKKKLKELDMHLEELSAGMDEFHGEAQGVLNTAIDKLASGNETTLHSLDDELATMKEENRASKEELD